MIIRRIKWALLLTLLSNAVAQNARSYDTNDWIPIDPNGQDGPKKATGRVLNLDAPNQKFFPDEDYVRKRPQTQQFLRETSHPKGRQHKTQEQPYKFETLTPNQQQQFIQQQLVQNQQQLAQNQYQQVLQQQVLSQELRAPPQHSPNLYGSAPEQYIPFNDSFYQSLNPTAINQELLGAIQNSQNSVASSTTPKNEPTQEKETVQLLYVPLENLKPNQQVTQQSQNIYRQVNSPRQEKQVQSKTQHHKQNQIQNIRQDFVSQALAAHKLQQQLQQGHQVVLQDPSTTTSKPKKRKAHQPPLAVYMGKEGQAEVTDVLNVLKRTRTIAVQDSVGPDSPQVFVGPSNLEPPDGYTKFPLPYLSSVEGNRIERKVDQLPFFVAPLSYKTPDGYSKIPLPSPHVGSVVVKELQEATRPQAEQKQPFGEEQGRFLVPSTTPQNRGEFTGFQVGPKSGFAQSYQSTTGKDFLSDYQPKAVNPQNYQGHEVLSGVQGLRGGEVKAQTYQDQGIFTSVLGGGYQPQEVKAQNYQGQGILTSVQGLHQNPTSTPSYQDHTQGFQIPNYQQADLQGGVLQTYNQLPQAGPQFQIPNYQQVDLKPSNYQADLGPTTYQADLKSGLSPNFQADLKPTKYQADSKPIGPTTYQVDLKSGLSPNFQVDLKPNNYQADLKSTKYQADLKPIEPTAYQADLKSGLSTNYQVDLKPNTPVNYQVDSKPNLSTTYRAETDAPTAKPETGRYRSSIDDSAVTLRSQLNVYGFSDTPVRQTTTTEAALGHGHRYKLAQEPEYSPSSFSGGPNRGLDQFILDQINSELVAGTQSPHLGPPVTQNYYEISTTPRKSRKRQRVSSTAATTSTTPNPYEPDRYTVLEEFSIKPKSTTTQRYTTEVETIPANVYKLNSDQLEPVYVQNQEHVLNQDMLDQQILLSHRAEHTTRSPQTYQIEAQNPPLVYNRGQNLQDQQQTNPYLPGLINNLQGVKSLLVPNLLVPTTHLPSPPPPTEIVQELTTTRVSTTEPPRVETTKRSRGRQRANTARHSTSTPRRTVSRRRPTPRTTTEHQILRTTTDNTPTYEPTRRSSSSSNRQRFRTRGRPAQRDQHGASERSSQETTPSFRQPPLEGGFQASAGEPQSYMQFEHTVNDQEVITVRSQEAEPIRDYHQVYSLGPQSTERAQEEATPVLDVQITHPITERTGEPVVISRPSQESEYVRVNSNSGGVLFSGRAEEITTRAPVRMRGRTRTRARFSSTTPVTTTTTITTTTQEPKQEQSEEEFFGFIRAPSFQKPAPLVYTTTEQPVQVFTSQQTPRTLIQFVDDDPEPVHFVGEIRPKYPSTTTTTTEPPTEPPKFRTRARIRVPTKRPSTAVQHQHYNEVNSPKLDDQITRRSTVVRSRSRGKSHFKPPEALGKKTDDEDVEGGNYPASYVTGKQEATPKPSAFQITVDPYAEEEEEDQETHSSFYRPKVLKNPPRWVEASATRNDIAAADEKPAESSEERTTEEALTTTEPTSETTIRPGGRRRGVWKLVRHGPVDQFETAESQNYQSVLNSFDQIEKVKGPAEDQAATTEASLLDTLYNMFGIAEKNGEPQDKSTTGTTTTSSTEATAEEAATTTISPTFPEEFTEPTTTQQANDGESEDYNNSAAEEETDNVEKKATTEEEEYEDEEEITSDAPLTTTTTETSVKKYDVEPWEMRAVKTSTSTEVSHETEICYKGRCVKTKEGKKKS